MDWLNWTTRLEIAQFPCPECMVSAFSLVRQLNSEYYISWLISITLSHHKINILRSREERNGCFAWSGNLAFLLTSIQNFLSTAHDNFFECDISCVCYMCVLRQQANQNHHIIHVGLCQSKINAVLGSIQFHRRTGPVAIFHCVCGLSQH